MNTNYKMLGAVVALPLAAFFLLNNSFLLGKPSPTAVILALDESGSKRQDKVFNEQQEKLCRATTKHLRGGDHLSTLLFADTTQVAQETAYTDKMQGAKFCKQLKNTVSSQKTIGQSGGTDFVMALEHGSRRLQHLAAESKDAAKVRRLLILSLHADDSAKVDVERNKKIVDAIDIHLRDRTTVLVLTKDNRLTRTLDQINSPHFKVCPITSHQHCLDWAFSAAAKP